MALIDCPECGNKISDKAVSCPHCGYPLVEKNHCIINGVDIDCSFVLDKNVLIDSDLLELCQMEMAEKTNLDMKVADQIVEQWSKSGKIPPVFNGKVSTWEDDHREAIQQSQQNVPKCPKCNSTAITTGARGVSWFWGTIGSSKTVNCCANCGYTWKPNGR